MHLVNAEARRLFFFFFAGVFAGFPAKAARDFAADFFLNVSLLTIPFGGFKGATLVCFGFCLLGEVDVGGFDNEVAPASPFFLSLKAPCFNSFEDIVYAWAYVGAPQVSVLKTLRLAAMYIYAAGNCYHTILLVEKCTALESESAIVEKKCCGELMSHT